MQSRSFLVCAALAGFALANGPSLVAHAADAKAKAKKKSDDASSEDKTGIGKTLQWEDKVMGPDDKKSELDKIRKAQEINKAAAEKAEREKAANAAREAKEREAAAKAGPTTQKRGGDVALPSLPDEGPSGAKTAKHTDVSPKLETEAAKAPPPAMKPADDKFIDKLLKEESGSKKKKASTAEDQALVDMLATEKPSKATGKKGRKDGVDDLLDDAEKSGPMPEKKIKHETPEWAKPEIRESAPTPVAAVPIKQPKRNDGIIRVVQGSGPTTSAGSARPAVATSSSTRNPPAPAGSGTRRQAAAINSRPGDWADPFSDPPSRKAGPSKQVAAAKRPAYDDDDVRPAPSPVRRASAVAPAPAKSSRASGSGDWDDPFSAPDRKTTGTRRAAPVETSKPTKAPARGSGKWDDPFTSNDAPAGKPGRAAAANRESKKPVAAPAHRVAAAPAEAPAKAPAQGRWGILKKSR
jgi:hypothetical protein